MELEKEKILISIVSPVYRAEKIVDELVRRIIESVSIITDNFEIILVEDGSPDNSWEAIERNCQLDKRVKGVKLSRNFGQHAAITAGLQTSSGQWIVVMDCDLQDRPEEIPRLYEKALEGFDVVFASRSIRIDSYVKKKLSSIFHYIFSYLVGVKSDSSIANFGIFKNRVVQEFNKMDEKTRIFPMIVKWMGFPQTKIDVIHSERHSGDSSYNINTLISLALNIMLAYSDKPLKLAVKLGFSISLLSFIVSVFYLVTYWLGEIKVDGYTSLMVSIWFLSGLNIIVVGIVGLYVGRTFQGIKNRPVFIDQTRINC